MQADKTSDAKTLGAAPTLATDEQYIRNAIDLARDAAKRNEVPIGAVIVRNGSILAAASNRTIRDQDELSNAKFSVFAGWEVTGWPIVTIRRGEVVYQDGKILASAGSGQVLPRQRWQKPMLP